MKEEKNDIVQHKHTFFPKVDPKKKLISEITAIAKMLGFRNNWTYNTTENRLQAQGSINALREFKNKIDTPLIQRNNLKFCTTILTEQMESKAEEYILTINNPNFSKLRRLRIHILLKTCMFQTSYKVLTTRDILVENKQPIELISEETKNDNIALKQFSNKFSREGGAPNQVEDFLEKFHPEKIVNANNKNFLDLILRDLMTIKISRLGRCSECLSLFVHDLVNYHEKNVNRIFKFIAPIQLWYYNPRHQISKESTHNHAFLILSTQDPSQELNRHGYSINKDASAIKFNGIALSGDISTQMDKFLNLLKSCPGTCYCVDPFLRVFFDVKNSRIDPAFAQYSKEHSKNGYDMAMFASLGIYPLTSNTLKKWASLESESQKLIESFKKSYPLWNCNTTVFYKPGPWKDSYSINPTYKDLQSRSWSIQSSSSEDDLPQGAISFQSGKKQVC